MTNWYRKWGSVIRYENGTTVRVEEAGEASDEGDVFEARPSATRMSVSVPPGFAVEVRDFVEQTLASVQQCDVERLIVSAGVSLCETGGVSWSEEVRRVHLSLVKGQLRVLVDLASFDVAAVVSADRALGRAGVARAAPLSVRLAPNVAAALLPSLLGEIAIEQSGSGFDGIGQTVDTRAVTDDPPPNWYRPSYTVRPRRAWLNLRPLSFGTVDERVPQAVALLAPVDGMSLRVLCSDGDAVFPTMVDASRIAAVSRDAPVWYPYEAGSFGTQIML